MRGSTLRRTAIRLGLRHSRVAVPPREARQKNSAKPATRRGSRERRSHVAITARGWLPVAAAALLVVSLHGQQPAQPPKPQEEQSFKFRSGVELINVTATVSDTTGRFVGGLRAEDFVVYEDNQPVEVTHFSADRVPVSLGIAVDTSGSMQGEKMQSAQSALERFLFDLLDERDEIFLFRFSDTPMLMQSWTTDRQLLSRALGRMVARGGTAMYDTVADAVPLAEQGRNRKKALLIISDGNDTSSRTSVVEVKQLVRESEVLVYAVGIDGDGEPTFRPTPTPRNPIPIPFPGRDPRRPGGRPGWPPIGGGGGGGWPGRATQGDDRVNVVALRDITDDSGGRTEIVRHATDLNPATANIADELSKQYYLGYASPTKKDGRWHSIRVEVRRGNYRVRARRGYIAS
jgi:Ca-activated chloride channel homolog